MGREKYPKNKRNFLLFGGEVQNLGEEISSPKGPEKITVYITFCDTQTMAHLKQLLDTINVTYAERIFESENGIAELGPEPFVSK